MSVVEIVTLGVVVALLLAWYLTYTAARLHRLHTRVEGALAALDAQLVRRADLAVELANSARLDPATSLIVAGAAADSLGAAADELTGLDWVEGALAEREAVESDLTAALTLALGFARDGDDMGDDLLRRIEDAHHRVHLARRFYNDAVVDVQRLRRGPAVRLFRLAGHAQLPRTVEFDDDLRGAAGPDPWGSEAPPRSP